MTSLRIVSPFRSMRIRGMSAASRQGLSPPLVADDFVADRLAGALPQEATAFQGPDVGHRLRDGGPAHEAGDAVPRPRPLHPGGHGEGRVLAGPDRLED